MNFKKIMLWKKPIPKAYMLHDLIYVNSENDKLTEMENTLVIVWGERGSKGWEGAECSHERAVWGVFMVLELFSILTVVLDTGTYTYDKIA